MDIGQSLATMALEIQTLDSLPDVIDRIAQYARVAVNCDDSGVLLVKARGKVETPAATSGLIVTAHQLQAELDEGPCVESVRGGLSTYVSGDVGADHRWPTWGPRVAALGYHSVVSVRLESHGQRHGSLNAYSSTPEAFSPDDVAVMELLAAHASVALSSAKTVDDLRTALRTRTTIGNAQGVLMAVYDIDAEDAFQYLRRLSMDNNRKLLDVAEDVLAQRHELRKFIQ